MKLGDMTFKQIAEICANHICSSCPFYNKMTFINCRMLQYIPSQQDLSVEVEINAENQI